MDPLVTILSVPAIVAIVEVIKAFGVNGKYSLVVALAVAVALNVLNFQYGASGLYLAIIQGVLVGLSAAGVYDVAKAASTTTKVSE